MNIKKTILFINLFALLSILKSEKANYIDIAKLGYEQYQDIFVNGKIIQKANNNHVHCDIRYQIINNFLNKYDRPFTVLDIGASQGYYTFKAATEYPKSVFIMIESNNRHYPLVGQQLFELCKANNLLNNIILLNKVVKVEDLKMLSECEHFDVILALNIIHWFDDSWKEITDTILNMGNHIIIETPPQETIINSKNNQLRKEIEEYLLNKKAQIIGEVPRHTSDTKSKIYLISKNKSHLQRKTWLLPPLKEKNYLIEADFKRKKLTKKVDYPENSYQTSDWIPGINLITFKMYHGIYPTSEMLKNLLHTIRDNTHNDWMINNMILQGNKLKLIDFNDPTHNPGGPGGGNNASIPVLFDNHIKLMDINDPQKIEHYFWNYLIRYPIKNRSRNRFVKSLIKKNDLVFDIGAQEGINTQVYASNHAKVISIESNLVKADILHRNCDYNDQIIIISKKITDKISHSKNKITLNELTDIYGVPDYCSLNTLNYEKIILQMHTPIKCLSFPFSMTNVKSIKKCLKHLENLDYKYFNFSCRDIPLFMIESWTKADTLVEKLQECMQKDHADDLLQGLIYAKS